MMRRRMGRLRMTRRRMRGLGELRRRRMIRRRVVRRMGRGGVRRVVVTRLTVGMGRMRRVSGRGTVGCLGA